MQKIGGPAHSNACNGLRSGIVFLIPFQTSSSSDVHQLASPQVFWFPIIVLTVVWSAVSHSKWGNVFPSSPDEIQPLDMGGWGGGGGGRFLTGGDLINLEHLGAFDIFGRRTSTFTHSEKIIGPRMLSCYWGIRWEIFEPWHENCLLSRCSIS